MPTQGKKYNIQGNTITYILLMKKHRKDNHLIN